MGNNLPPGVSISDSDAPWNQQHPDPSDIRVRCTECDWSGTVAETDYEDAAYCPECGVEVNQQ